MDGLEGLVESEYSLRSKSSLHSVFSLWLSPTYTNRLPVIVNVQSYKYEGYVSVYTYSLKMSVDENLTYQRSASEFSNGFQITNCWYPLSLNCRTCIHVIVGIMTTYQNVVFAFKKPTIEYIYNGAGGHFSRYVIPSSRTSQRFKHTDLHFPPI